MKIILLVFIVFLCVQHNGVCGSDGFGMLGSFFIDANGDGKKSGSEKPLAGINFILTDQDGNPAKDGDGNDIPPTPSSDTGDMAVFSIANAPAYYIKFSGLEPFNVIDPGQIGPFKGEADDGNVLRRMGDLGFLPTGTETCSGTTFFDFNKNTIMDEMDKPYPNVKVSIYAPNYNYLIGTTVSDENGHWQIGNLPKIHFRLVFEFIEDLTTSTGLAPIRKVIGGQSDINIGLLDVPPGIVPPTVSSDNTPTGFLAVLSVKSSSKGPNKELPSVFRFSADAVGFGNGTGKYVSSKALHGDVGSVNGITYRPESGDIFVSAYYRLDSGFGPGGPAAIYKISNNSIVSKHVRVNEIYGIFGDVPIYDSVLPIVTPAERTNANVYTSKSSFGGLTSTRDNLYVASLFTNEIIKLPTVDQPTSDNSDKIEVPNMGCKIKSDWHIFAVKIHKEALYVGGVCSGESGNGQLDAVVLSYTSEWSKVAQFPLNFKRGSDNAYGSWNTPGVSQPILAELVFSSDDSIAVGIRDRKTETSAGYSYPDTLHLCKDSGGKYHLEANGACGSKSSLHGSKPRPGPGGYKFFDASTTFSPRVGSGVARAGPNSIVASGQVIYDLKDAGVAWFDTTNGSLIKRFQLYDEAYADRLNGISSLTALDPAAPLRTIENGKVWFDSNGDGKLDTSELGIQGAKVYLFEKDKLDGTPIAHTSSDISGDFSFVVEPGKGYACLIDSYDMKSLFGDFIVSQISNKNGLSPYVKNDAKTNENNDIVTEVSPLRYSIQGFAGCNFGITKENNFVERGYGFNIVTGDTIPNVNLPKEGPHRFIIN